MLRRSTHQHFAFQRSLTGEHRLLCLSTGGGQGSGQTDDTTAPEREGLPPIPSFEEQRQMDKLKQQEREKQETETQRINRTKLREELLRKVPQAELQKLTFGAFYISEILSSLLSDKELKKLAKKAHVRLSRAGDVKTMVDELIDNSNQAAIESSIEDLLKGKTPALATRLLRHIKQEVDGYDRMRQLAPGRVKHGNKRGITEGCFNKIKSRQQELDMQGRSLLDWLQTLPVAERQNVLSQTGLDVDPKFAPYYLHHWEEFILVVENTLRVTDHLEVKNLRVIEDMMRKFKNRNLDQHTARSIQEYFYLNLRDSMPILEAVIDSKVKEEAAQTQEWYESQLRTHLADMKTCETECLRSTGQAHVSEDEIDRQYAAQHGGISASRVRKELASIEESLQLAEQKHDWTALDGAQYAEHFRQLREERDVYGHVREKSIYSDLLVEQEAADQWADNIRPLLSEVTARYRTSQQRDSIEETYGVSDIFTSLERVQTDVGTRHAQQNINTYYYTNRRRDQLGTLIEALHNENITDILRSTREAQEGEGFASPHEIENLTIIDRVEQTRDRLRAVLDTFGILAKGPVLGSGICRSLAVHNQVITRGVTLQNYLDKISQELLGPDVLQEVNVEVNKMEAAARMIDQLEKNPTIVRFDAAPGQPKAFYNYADTAIHIDRSIVGKEYNETIEHEKAHAVMDVLLRRSGVFPFMLQTTLAMMRRKNKGIEAQLNGLAEKWGIEQQWEHMRANLDDRSAQALKNELLLEEALAKREEIRAKQQADATYDPRTEFDQDELAVINAVDDAFVNDDLTEQLAQHETDPLLKEKADRDGLRKHFRGRLYDEYDDLLGGGTATREPVEKEGNDSDGAGGGERISMVQRFNYMGESLERMHKFSNTFPDRGTFVSQTLPQLEKNYEFMKDVFNKQQMDGQSYPQPELNPAFQEQVTKLEGTIGTIEEDIRKFDYQNQYLGDIQPSRGVADFFRIQWLSPVDLYLMMRDAVEDVKRMWERRSTQNRSKVGESLFRIFPEVGHNYFGLGYMGRLETEFKRREQEQEDTEVDVWRKGLKDKDSYELLLLIESTVNRDQVKALMYELAERGRIDWGNKGLWNTLSTISNFRMPVRECERDVYLRDTWLQKLIADIWGDKDLYLKWKGQNDSSYKSERDKYLNIAADKAQVPDAMLAELAKQLELYEQAKATGSLPPADVNPHLYESVLHYAMDKGKMSMEAKFYFLIRGLETGLLPHDRLTALMHELSTSTFPFLDYFSLHNNTPTEIKQIARRIKEPGKQFEPGPRTSLFLMYEVARDEHALSRVMKVLTRAGDQLDHEDIPMLVSFGDYGLVEELNGIIAGQRQKLTKEGVKNGYVGYNTFFKAYGLREELEKNGEARLTNSDIHHLIRIFAGYIHYDNIAAGQAAHDGRTNRQWLSWEQMEMESMPSGSGRTPSQFRNPMNQFVLEVVRAYGITEIENVQHKDGVKNLPIEEYLGALRGKRDPKDSLALFKASKPFVEQLSNKVMSDPQTFRNILLKNTGKLLNEGTTPLGLDDARMAMGLS